MASAVQQQLMRAKSTIKNIREQGREVTRRTTSVVMAAGGGAVSGVLAAKAPTIPNTRIPTDFALGGALVVVAMADGGGEYSDQLLALGSGMISAGVARETQRALNR